ncbi:MAG: hypothetical protein GX651_02525 [Methanomicrobiales archaeon]|nr:hypothetical protein [Methanomicrobiales archaeon]
MPRRFCPDCGAPQQFRIQKFCTACGAPLPDAPAASQKPGGLPVTVLVAGAVILLLVIGAGAVLLLPGLTKTTGTAPAGIAGSGDAVPLSGSQPGTPASGLTTATTVPVTTIVITPATTPPTTVPTTIITTIPTTTRTPTPRPITTTPTPEPRPTSMITLEDTQVPPQPPASSYTSSTEGAPFIDPDALEMRIHELTNSQRSQNGLSTLSYDTFLADIARGHSWDMVQRDFFEHVNPDGDSARDRGDAAGYPCIRVIGKYTYSGISENLYMGHRASSYYTNESGAVTSYDWRTLEDIAQVTVNGWMESPGHRENILAPHLSYEGIGIAFGPDDKVYATQNFC